MRTLSPQEKRTVRFGSIAIAIYLVLFGGMQLWKYGRAKHAEYQTLVREAQKLKQEVQLYDARAESLKKLMATTKIDPARLGRSNLVAAASLAIQQAAAGSGIQVGPVREAAARATGKELATVQFECTGPVPSITGLLHRLETVGYPVLVDTVQITAEPTRPGMIKLNLTVLILDYDQWKKEARNA